MSREAPTDRARPNAFAHGVALILEKLLRSVIHPRLRARLLRLFGARIGRNVRIYEVQFVNLASGFRNLYVEDDVHVGPGCLLDLKGPLRLRRGAVLSPRVTVVTHRDPGSEHDSPLMQLYPPEARGVEVGAHAWIGAGATLLDGTRIGERAVVGAGAVVIRDVADDSVVAGVPARAVGEAS